MFAEGQDTALRRLYAYTRTKYKLNNQIHEQNPRDQDFYNDLADGRPIRQMLIRNYFNNYN